MSEDIRKRLSELERAVHSVRYVQSNELSAEYKAQQADTKTYTLLGHTVSVVTSLIRSGNPHPVEELIEAVHRALTKVSA